MLLVHFFHFMFTGSFKSYRTEPPKANDIVHKHKIYGLQDTTDIFLDNQNQHLGDAFSFVGQGIP